MSAPDLLPCPFCGNAPRVIEDDSYDACQVFCAGDGTEGSCPAEPCVYRRKSDLPDAIAAWNTRTPPPLPPQVEKALKGELP